MSFFIAFQEKNIDQLGAPRHKGMAKIGLDCSGRLLPGFLFDGNGNVVPSLNPDTKPKKRKKRLSDSCQNECKPCDEKIDIKTNVKKSILLKEFKKAGAKAGIRANPSIKKNILEKAIKAVKTIRERGITITKVNEIQNIQVIDIFTDGKRFQNRNKLDQRIIKNIVDSFDATQFDPIIIWKDAKLKKYLVLAGHHRFEAVKQLGHKTIQAKIAVYNEKEAIEFAKEKSNANRTLELPQERAKIYRAHIAGDNLSKKQILELAKTNEGKNANYIVNLAYLNPKGLTLQALDQLSETPDKQNATLIEKIADWIGDARKQFNGKLNDANETEMFKFLQDKNQSLRIKTKSEFLQKITAITGLLWKLGDVLNLARFSNKTEGESMYEAEYKDLQKQLETAIDNKQSLIERIKNPKHQDFIKPDDKDYKSIIVALEKAIEKYNEQIKSLQTKLIVLSRKKGNFTNAGSNQVGLFGILEVSTEQFKKMTVTELREFTLKFYNENLKGKKVAINKVLKSVEFVGRAGRKILKPIYSEKVAIIEHLEQLIKDSTYNNFGIRKETDSKDILGFLNFKSKIIIDGIKKHVRISVILDVQRKTKLKSFSIGKIKSGNSIEAQTNGIPRDGQIKPLSKNKYNNNNTKNNNSSLNIVHEAKIIEPEPIKQSNSLANKLQSRPIVGEYFNIYCKQLAQFLGRIEIKTKESVFVSLTGGEGSGKTRMCFQMMNALAQNYKVGHASIEEHPESNLYFDKAKEYLNQTALENITAPEINSLTDLHNLILKNDVIVIDSYTKMKEIHQGFEVDKDLRKKYNGKLFIVIFQQTTTGAMRGGSKSQFDADVVIFTEKFEDNYKKNYIYCTKNRYNKEIGLQYNIFNRALQGETTVVQPQKFIENAPQMLLEAPKKLLKFKVD